MTASLLLALALAVHDDPAPSKDHLALAIEPAGLFPLGDFANSNSYRTGATTALDLRLAVHYELANGFAPGITFDYSPLRFVTDHKSAGPISTSYDTSGTLTLIGLSGRYVVTTSGQLRPFVEASVVYGQLSEHYQIVTTTPIGNASASQDSSFSGIGVRLGAGALYQSSPSFRIGLGVDLTYATLSGPGSNNTSTTEAVNHLRISVPLQYLF
jgi:opacity protein-like surface antigen